MVSVVMPVEIIKKGSVRVEKSIKIDTSHASNLASSTDSTRIQTPHTLFRYLRAEKNLITC